MFAIAQTLTQHSAKSLSALPASLTPGAATRLCLPAFAYLQACLSRCFAHAWSLREHAGEAGRMNTKRGLRMTTISTRKKKLSRPPPRMSRTTTKAMAATSPPADEHTHSLAASDGTDLDQRSHAQLAALSGGISPTALRMAFADWGLHMSRSPAHMTALLRDSGVALAALSQNLMMSPWHQSDAVTPALHEGTDRRFSRPGWNRWPFNVYSQAFKFTEARWRAATHDVRGVSNHHEDVVGFTVRQWLDVISPANFLLTNPVALDRSLESNGLSLWRGAQNFVEDAGRLQKHQPALGLDYFQAGSNLAITPGKVIFRNHLIELIQYAPQGKSTRPEPILMVSAWIMKYYILDLSPHNSLINYLVQRGHTVFAISWRNPGGEDRDLGMDDYLQQGVMAALDAVTTLLPRRKVHAVGYCLGGTLLAIAAAAMGRDGDDRLATMTLFAAQTDFTEPGELALFIDESQVSFIEDIMSDKGYLDTHQMAGAFRLINSADLIWSRMLNTYLMGTRAQVSDLAAWNADGTRLPFRMHSEYLRQLFLNNDLACGRYRVAGKPIALTDVRCPIFCVGTARDHVAPWRSVHKLHLLTDVPLTFLLTSGGHNVGIVNPPGMDGRSYQMLTRAHNDKYLAPDAWLEAAPTHDGSWWPAWARWLETRSGKARPAPPMGNRSKGFAPICDAPGTYVLQP
jgi:polyhydroxyalkanoate synthase subunit PhaC